MNTSGQRGGYKSLVGWVGFGAGIAKMHAAGTVLTDLHQENLGYLGNGQGPVLIDRGGGIERIKYPDEWELLPIALMSLLNWLPDVNAAAFRFGYLQRGGAIGEAVFCKLRTLHNINAFNELHQFQYGSPKVEAQDATELFPQDKSWQMLVPTLGLNQLADANYSIGEHERGRVRKETIGVGWDDWIEESYYRQQLACSLFHLEFVPHLEALLNLVEIYLRMGKPFIALGIARFIQNRTQGKTMPPDWGEYIGSLSQNERYALSDHEIAKLELIADIDEILMYLWCLDDCVTGQLARRISVP